VVLKRFKCVLLLFLTAIAVCTVVGYVVLAQPLQARTPEPTVKTSVDLRIEFPDIWPWNRGDGPGSLTFPLWRDPES
jgi:hypothetical protein